MTVRQLKKQLEKINPNAEVWLDDNGWWKKPGRVEVGTITERGKKSKDVARIVLGKWRK